MANVAQYNPIAVVVKVGGFTITDPSDSNIAEITAVGTAGKVTYGADGNATFVADSIRGIKVKISVRQNTPGTARLWKLLSTQMGKSDNGEAMPVLPVVVYDGISGSTWKGGGIFTEIPTFGYAKEDSAREYTLELPKGLTNGKDLAS